MSKCDLQVHSRHSNRPSEWILRRLGMPESYTAPSRIYDNARAAGMDFVTVTDHDSINGCLEIADRPGVFLSEEVTTYFRDGVKVHVLVWGLNEKQHQQIQVAREDIHQLVALLRAEGLAHGLAHPLFSVDTKLTVAHFEKLLLLFNVFEGINGLRNPLGNEVLQSVLNGLTQEKIEQLADRHGIAPYGSHPWRKSLTGGSDDHGGLFIARAYTETPHAPTVQAFLKHLLSGNTTPSGQHGTPQTMASSTYFTAYRFMHDHMARRAPLYAELMGKMFERFLAGQNPTAFSFGEKVGIVKEAILSGQIFSVLTPGASLPRDLNDFFNQPVLKNRIDHILRSEPTAERRSFIIASEITNHLSFRFFDQMVRQLSTGDMLGGLQSFSALVPVTASVLPYIVAFQSLFAGRYFLEDVSDALLSERPPELQNNKRAWLTDTLEDVNGVARTICTMTKHLREKGHDITVITSRSEITVTGVPIKNFQPVGEFELPEYKLQKLSFPPILEMLDYIQREGFSELVISTPGPVGVVGLIASKMFGLRVSGIYHTDFPQYVKILSDDEFMESLTWNYMHWFYGQLDLIYSNSKYYSELWTHRGIPAERLRILPRGLDTDLFNTCHRTEKFWTSRGAEVGSKILLYVGRVSKEKDLDLVPEIAKHLERLRKESATAGKKLPKFTWCFVGDGPYREELSALMPQAIFTGILTGLELGQAYASSDYFVFPSTTDTYGNVIVEACAAGLPVIVSDIGGPKELVRTGIPGIVCERRNATAFAEAIIASLDQPHTPPPNLDALRGWDTAADAFWNAAPASRNTGPLFGKVTSVTS